MINCKKRHSKELDSGKIYWFEPNMDQDSLFARCKLAEANDIEVITEDVGKSGYKRYYKDLPGKMKNLL